MAKNTVLSEALKKAQTEVLSARSAEIAQFTGDLVAVILTANNKVDAALAAQRRAAEAEAKKLAEAQEKERQEREYAKRVNEARIDLKQCHEALEKEFGPTFTRIEAKLINIVDKRAKAFVQEEFDNMFSEFAKAKAKIARHIAIKYEVDVHDIV